MKRAIVYARVSSVVDHIVIEHDELVVHYNPGCLVQMDGTPVRSKHGWLPVRGLLRTAAVRLPMPVWRLVRLAA